MEVEDILDWLDATRNLKEIRKENETTRAYASIFSRASTETEAELYAAVEKEQCSHELLRRARVRLDIVALLTWRRFIASLGWLSFNLHIYVDGSPQVHVLLDRKYYRRKVCVGRRFGGPSNFKP